MLAGELALAGVDVAIVERRPGQELAGSRAGGLQARTIEVLDQRGIAERFLAEGKTAQVAGFAEIPLDISDFPTRHNYGLGLWQNHIERILAGWIDELRVTIYRGRDITGFAQDTTGVDIALADGDKLHTTYLVGCDGGRSVIRKTVGIQFPGWDPTTSWIIAEVEMAHEPAWGIRHDDAGIHGIGKADGGRVRVVSAERQVATHEPTLRELSDHLVALYGTDFGAHSPVWLSRFTDTTRQAATYRDRRVLLAGDAAHVHPPQGGQGLNIGVQDAVNLGWKLAAVVNQTAPESLLDTYHAERHPIAARVLRNTMALVALARVDDRIKAVREVIGELLHMDEPRKRFAGMMSGLDVRYELGDGHPLVGRRMPDLELATDDAPVRTFTLLHAARPVLVRLDARDARDAIDIAPWSDRVRVVRATYSGEWQLPVIGAVPAPPAVLIRPDGYVAWAGGDGLVDALVKWFGPPRAA
jgi:3-(3-hydroxy-phenyl)propionate hydroxylase